LPCHFSPLQPLSLLCRAITLRISVRSPQHQAQGGRKTTAKPHRLPEAHPNGHPRANPRIWSFWSVRGPVRFLGVPNTCTDLCHTACQTSRPLKRSHNLARWTIEGTTSQCAVRELRSRSPSLPAPHHRGLTSVSPSQRGPALPHPLRASIGSAVIPGVE
jgi:hypothetical protein